MTCSTGGCKREAILSRKSCQYHLDRGLAHHQRYNEQGLCVCGNLLETKTRCHECRIKHARRSRLSHQKARLIVLDLLGGSCECCGESNTGFLTVDHTNGGGSSQRKRDNMDGGRFYSKLARLLLLRQPLPDNFRVLCWNCNCGREYNSGVCPHHTGGRIERGEDSYLPFWRRWSESSQGFTAHGGQ